MSQNQKNEPIFNIMGQLRYLADRTRPDLLYPVNFISRYMHQPTDAVYVETHRLLQYLKHTIEHELIKNIWKSPLYMTQRFIISTEATS
jgi:hypothetical protein